MVLKNSFQCVSRIQNYPNALSCCQDLKKFYFMHFMRIMQALRFLFIYLFILVQQSLFREKNKLHTFLMCKTQQRTLLKHKVQNTPLMCALKTKRIRLSRSPPKCVGPNCVLGSGNSSCMLVKCTKPRSCAPFHLSQQNVHTMHLLKA